MTSPRDFASTCWELFGGKGNPKGALLEMPKIENGTKIKLFSKDRHQDPLTTVPGSGFEKYTRSENGREAKNMSKVLSFNEIIVFTSF